MDDLRILSIRRGSNFEIDVNGQKCVAYPGETVATVLYAAGIREFTRSDSHLPSSRFFCGMGSCRECLVTVNDEPNCRACQTLASPGMKVLTTHAE